MSKIDRDMAEAAHQASRDQDKAEVTDMASDIGLFYRGLLAEKIPTDIAGPLAMAFASMVVFSGCACEG